MLPNAGSAGSIPGWETKIPTYHAAKKKIFFFNINIAKSDD